MSKKQEQDILTGDLIEYLNFAEKQWENFGDDSEFSKDEIVYFPQVLSSRKKQANQYTKFDLDDSTYSIISETIIKSAPFLRGFDKPMSTTKDHGEKNNKTKKSNKINSDAQLVMRSHHVMEVAEISKYIANRLGLNPDLAYLTGLIHDIGHSWSGHSGERILSSIANRCDCGYIVHNAMGAYIMERERIIERIAENVEQLNPDENIEEVKRFLRYAIDGMVCHNGEGTVGKIIPEISKSEEQMKNEIRKCFTEKGADKKIVPATMEGAIIRYADIIAYSRSDIVNAFRMIDEDGKKVLEDFDDEYLGVIGTLLAKETDYTAFLNLETKYLRKIYYLKKEISEREKTNEKYNTTDETIEKKKCELNQAEEKYAEFEKLKVQYAKLYINLLKQDKSKKIKEIIPQMMQNAFKKDLIENSIGKSYITMSPLIRTMFFKLRSINSKKIVPKSRRKYEIEELAPAVYNFSKILAEALKKSGLVDSMISTNQQELINGTKDEKECKEYVEKISKEDSAENYFIRKIIHYYDSISGEMKKDIYNNVVESITSITKRDILIALGKETYSGDYKKEYFEEKIVPLVEKIKKFKEENGIGQDEELANEHLKGIENIVVAQKMKNLEDIMASKMAIEYLGGMTDKTIKESLETFGLITLRAGTGRCDTTKTNGAEKEHISRMTNTFSDYDEMILD